jgi:hypothetical protein
MMSRTGSASVSGSKKVTHVAWGNVVRLLVTGSLLGVLLAGCGGTDPTVTPAVALATPTPVAAATATAVPATPTAAPSPTPTLPAATPTSAPTPVPAPTRPPPTSTPAPTATPQPAPTPVPAAGVEVLFAALLPVSALPEGWTLDWVGETMPDEIAAEALCDINTFPGLTERLYQAEAEYSSPDGAQFMTQTIAAYPMLTAIQALNFARTQLAGCEEWTSSDGTVFTVTPVLLPLLAGDGYAYEVRFTLPEGQEVVGEMHVLRVRNVITTLSAFGVGGFDPEPFRQAAYATLPRLEIVYLAIDDPTLFPDIDLAMVSATQLLSRAEVAALPERWFEGPVIIPENENRYNVCGLGLFPVEFGAWAELQREFAVDRDAGPFLWQSVTTFPSASVAEEAMAHIRETLSCGEFADNVGTTWQVLDYPDVPLGDETHAIVAGVDLGARGSAQAEFLFARVGPQITTLIYVVTNDALDHGRVVQLAEWAVAKLVRYQD